jgi:DNA-binding NarL/FixJ family response regulator
LLAQEIEALVELGQPDRAEPLLQWLEQRAQAVDRPWAQALALRCRALLCSTAGDSAAALAAVDAALVQHARNPMPFERARTLLVKGRIHRRRKEKRLAAGALQEALGTFEAVGAPHWAATTQAELERLGRRPSTADELTPTERRVAELAAAGLSNHEIAERAFLTTKAVEGNLTRVYRKLGIRSRGGLARALPATDATHIH